jgi:hypothetical protein
MKKYLIKGVLALFAGAFLFSCSEKESEYVPVAQQKAKAFDDVFKEVYGDNIDPYQKWGFSDKMIIANGDSVEFEELDDIVAGSRTRTRAMAFTRGTMPSEPSFRDNNPITRPSASYSNSVPADAIYAANDFGAGATIYINEAYYESHESWAPSVDGKDNLTIYIVGNVTFHGTTSQNGNGTAICVTQGSTLTLGQVRDNLIVYLAPNATLNLPEWSTFQNSHAALYLSSGSQVNVTNVYFKNGTKVLNAGGTISASTLTLDQNSVLWNEGTVTVTNSLTLNNTSDMIYNASGKTISAGSIDIKNNNDLLYNDGTVTCSGNVTLHNSGAEFINNNTLTVSGNYSQAAGGKTHNVGKVTVSGKTDLTNSNSDWMNECEWTTATFDIDNYSSSAGNFNKGKLTVSGQFHLNRGTFVNDGGALVTCGSFLWEDTSNFYLGSKSKLNVSGTLTTKNYNSGYGFRGEGTEYAIIAANEIAKGLGDVQFSMSYYGNLYIDTNNHFAQGALDPDNDPPAQPYYYYDDTVLFSFNGDACPVTFTAPTCGSTPPVIGEGSSSEDSSVDEEVWSQVTSQSGRIFCEDLGQATREDLDFNDVVFDVIIWNYKTKTTTITTTKTWTTTDGKKDPGSEKTTKSKPVVTYSGEKYYAQVTLMAAGGTLPLTVANKEVHDAFGVGISTMVNTVNDYSTVYGSYKTLSPVAIGDVTKTVKYNGETKNLKLFTGYEKAIDIPIVVNYNGVSINELSASGGKAPHKLFVPLGTKWAVERKNLALAYPEFINYVSDANKSWTTSSSNNDYYMYTEGDTRGLSVVPTVIKNRRTSVEGIQKNMWTGTQPFGASWSLNNLSITFNVDKLYPGDRLRFYGKGIGEEAWINVSINNTKPYLIDSDFPNFVLDASDKKTMLGADEEGFVEVVLNETTAALLNQLIDENYSFVVQGRNFTLTRIAVVEF